MKKVLIAVLLMVGISSFAQEGKQKMTPEQKNEKHLKRMTTELDLNEKQQGQVKQLIAEQSAKREAIKKQMAEERKNMNDKMKVILTPEQFEKWKANQEKRKKEMKEIKEMKVE